MRDFAWDEFKATAMAFVVEKNAAGGMQAIAFTIIDRNPVTVDLGHAVRTARIERRCLALGSSGPLSILFLHTLQSIYPSPNLYFYQFL